MITIKNWSRSKVENRFGTSENCLQELRSQPLKSQFLKHKHFKSNKKEV